jgi:hypothetical protein
MLLAGNDLKTARTNGETAFARQRTTRACIPAVSGEDGSFELPAAIKKSNVRFMPRRGGARFEGILSNLAYPLATAVPQRYWTALRDMKILVRNAMAGRASEE